MIFGLELLIVPVIMGFLGLILGIRSIEGDEHYGFIGFGSMTMSAANAFSATILDAIAEPDFIVKADSKTLSLDIQVNDVLVWDVKEWHARTNLQPDIVGGENVIQNAFGGITKDNTINGNDAPISDVIAQGLTPGGSGAAVTGGVTGGPGTRTVGDEQPTRYVERFEYWSAGGEEQTAVGQVLFDFDNMQIREKSPYRVDGHDVHYLMTAAHYHQWLDSTLVANAGSQGIGAYVRRMSVDLKELMFDRAVILSILDALVVSS